MEFGVKFGKYKLSSKLRDKPLTVGIVMPTGFQSDPSISVIDLDGPLNTIRGY
jgi:hypothetical protein